MGKHAILSPSGAEKWVNCAGSAKMEQTFKNAETVSIYAAEGTAAHYLGSEFMSKGETPPDVVGLEIAVMKDSCAFVSELPEGFPEEQIHFYIPVTDSMKEDIDRYIASVLEFKGPDGILDVEQRFDISTITGEEDAEGTSDVVILRGTQLQVHDLKYGRKEVRAKENKQLLLYAMAAYNFYILFSDIDDILLVIHQPRVREEPDTWQISVKDLFERIDIMRTAANTAMVLLDVKDIVDIEPHLTPGEHCSKNYCKAQAFCPALAKLTKQFERTDIESLDNVTLLSDHAKIAPIVVAWAEAVEAQLGKKILEDGVEVPGFKAVLGRMGNREWRDKKEVETTLTQSMKLKHEIIYNKVVKSPTALEKHAKAGEIGPRQWKTLQDMITRSEAKLKVAPESDERPAVLVSGDHLADFEAVG